MDPTAALAEIHRAISEAEDACCFEHQAESFKEAVEKFEALDEWLSKGGFLPDSWAR